MTRPDNQAEREHDNYWQAVTDVAEGIVAELEDTDEERNELLSRLVHETIDQHDYVIKDDMPLQHSSHPCAALFNGTLLGHRYLPSDSFPFAAFAADTFEADVIQQVKKLLGDE